MPKKNRDHENPGISDLKWECIRRNAEYQADYFSLQEDPEADASVSIGETLYPSKRSYYASKWNLHRMESPDVPWDECSVVFPSGREIRAAPASGDGIAVAAYGFKSHQEEIKEQPNEKYFLWLKINPQAPVNEIKIRVHKLVMAHRRDLEIKQARFNEKITKRLSWIELYTKVLLEKPSPTYKWFRKRFDRQFQSKRETFIKAALLVRDPLKDPLRDLSREEIRKYMHSKRLADHKK